MIGGAGIVGRGPYGSSIAASGPAETGAYADAMAAMFCAYLESLAQGAGDPVMRP
jgi:hypothetical protein